MSRVQSQKVSNTPTYINNKFLLNRTISATRERIADEITPTSAEQSKTYKDNEETYAAAHAIDLNWDTRSLTSAGSHGKSWLKIKLSQVYCVQQVIWYYRSGDTFLTWTCSQPQCSCKGYYCNLFTLTVISERTAPNNTTPGCKYGDTVTVERKNGDWFGVSEIAITGRQGM